MTEPRTAPAPLSDLLDLLSEEPSVDAALGRREPVIAVADPGRALVLAGLVAASDRRPVLVGTPTQAEAERLAADVAAILGADDPEIDFLIDAIGGALMMRIVVLDNLVSPDRFADEVMAIITRLSSD